jgi:hypothetical protein
MHGLSGPALPMGRVGLNSLENKMSICQVGVFDRHPIGWLSIEAYPVQELFARCAMHVNPQGAAVREADRG